ncbi:MAG: TetR family transcriptional regulator [Coriobacteriales bacterium]|nr:TetR family transcriptional regulator [Coriobacteriales bacterium]
MGQPVLDRRTRYTRMVIREAFFALFREVGFSKMTVADICRRAEINRGTFYLHYEDKYALLDALIDEALETAPPLEGDAQASMCQRAPATEEYHMLYADDEVFARIATRVIERGAEQTVPRIMEEAGLSEQDAYLLFVHNAYGNLAVNRLLGWKRGPEFDHAQALFNAYARGGLAALGEQQ